MTSSHTLADLFAQADSRHPAVILPEGAGTSDYAELTRQITFCPAEFSRKLLPEKFDGASTAS